MFHILRNVCGLPLEVGYPRVFVGGSQVPVFPYMTVDIEDIARPGFHDGGFEGDQSCD
jgi:hypothetical protein